MTDIERERQPDTTTHDSIPAKTGKNDGDGTSGDCISRRASLEKIRTMQTYKLFAGDDMILIDKAQVQTELMMLPSAQPKPCEDAVSREAVLSMIDTYMNKSVELHYLPTSDGIKKLISILPSVQPFRNITMTDVLKYIDDMPEDVWLEFTCCLECRGWELQRRTAKWCGGDFA